MSTGYDLLDHPPASTQFYASRLGGPSGAVGFHTAETMLDRVAPFVGNEAVANWIKVRRDKGSYCSLHELDGRLPLVPWGYTTFSIATRGFNSRTMSIAAAMRASEMNPDDEHTHIVLRSMAREVFDYWRWLGYDDARIREAAHWGNGAEALAGPCLFHHGTVQSDRSDAFTTHARRAELEAFVVAEVISHLPSLAPAPARRRANTMFHFVNPDGRLELVDVTAAGVVVNQWETPGQGMGPWQPTHAPNAQPFEADDVCAGPVLPNGAHSIIITGGRYGLAYISYQAGPSTGPWQSWIPLSEFVNR